MVEFTPVLNKAFFCKALANGFVPMLLAKSNLEVQKLAPNCHINLLVAMTGRFN